MSFLKRLSLGKLKTVTAEHLQAFMDFLKKKDNPALLPMQIAYYTGLRIGEVCGLTWQDINLDEQYLTVRRSMRYNGQRHKTEIVPPNARKSAPWISATLWLTFSERQRRNSIRTALSMANSTTSITTKR